MARSSGITIGKPQVPPLRCGRDDKAKRRYSPEQRSSDRETAGPSTALRSRWQSEETFWPGAAV